jgi:hypothetical protein
VVHACHKTPWFPGSWKNLGWKPLCIGLTAALLVGCVSAGLIYLLKMLG